jgi:formamidopyrimidine-DNA glycosylase
MPELPEVQTTVNGLNKTVKGRTIIDVWTDYGSKIYNSQFSIFKKDQIKNSKFFKHFKKKIVGQKILKTERRAKNILIHLSNHKTILVHMKMTGYFFYNPPKNAPFVHFDLTLDNGKHLAFSDMRKFAKITLIPTNKLAESIHLARLGPEPLDKSFTYKIFKERLLKKPKGKIKTVLMDQTIISGIGNIYSDEILWRAGVHPLSIPNAIPEKNLRQMYKATQETLRKGIDFGGDSMFDYRNIKGERGEFQEHHRAYRRTGKKCQKSGCKGIIARKVIGARSAHFCSVHQKLFR